MKSQNRELAGSRRLQQQSGTRKTRRKIYNLVRREKTLKLACTGPLSKSSVSWRASSSRHRSRSRSAPASRSSRRAAVSSVSASRSRASIPCSAKANRGFGTILCVIDRVKSDVPAERCIACASEYPASVSSLRSSFIVVSRHSTHGRISFPKRRVTSTRTLFKPRRIAGGVCSNSGHAAGPKQSASKNIYRI